MAVGRVVRFHTSTGPKSLFTFSRHTLRQWTANGLDWSSAHVKQRIEERGIDVSWLENFAGGDNWQIVSIDLLPNRRVPVYMVVRRPITHGHYFWAVLVHEVVVTAWIRENSGLTKASPTTLREGDYFNSIDQKFLTKIRERDAQLRSASSPAGTETPEPRETETRPVARHWLRRLWERLRQGHRGTQRE